MQLDFEERIIAYILKDENAFFNLSTHLRSEHFENPTHRTIYKIIHNLVQKHKKMPTLDEVRTRLKKTLEGDSARTRAFANLRLTQLYHTAASPATYEEIAEHIGVNVLDAIATNILSRAESVDKLLPKLREAVTSLEPVLNYEQQKSFFPFSNKHMANLVKDWEQPVDSIPTGYPRIDKYLGRYGGMLRGELLIFLAYTGRGKTMWQLNLAVNMLEQGKKVLFLSLDNVNTIVEDRLYSRVTQIPMKADFTIRQRNAKVNKWKDAHPKFAWKNFVIQELPPKTHTVQMLRSIVTRVEKQIGKLDVVIVDYADLVKPSRNYSEKRHDHDDVYTDLRTLAKLHNVLVVTASQGNTKLLKEAMSAGTLGNMQEGNAKANSASLVLAIDQRESERDLHPPTCRIGILKNTKDESLMAIPFLADLARATFLEDDSLPDLRIGAEREKMEEQPTKGKSRSKEEYERKTKNNGPKVRKKQRFDPDDVRPD